MLWKLNVCSLLSWPIYKEDFLTEIRKEMSVHIGVVWIFVASIDDSDGDMRTHTHTHTHPHSLSLSLSLSLLWFLQFSM